MSTSRQCTRRLLAAGLIAAVVLCAVVGAAALRGTVAASRVSATKFRAGLSVVPMQPRMAAKLKAQGKALPALVGTTVNQGRKFNPAGSGITPISLEWHAEAAGTKRTGDDAQTRAGSVRSPDPSASGRPDAAAGRYVAERAAKGTGIGPLVLGAVHGAAADGDLPDRQGHCRR